MALSAEAAAVNTAVDGVITAIIAYSATLSAGDVIQFVAMDRGDSATNPDHRAAEGTGVVAPTFSTRFSIEHVNDGDFPIQIPAGPGGELVPLCWKVTNQGNDLTT